MRDPRRDLGVLMVIESKRRYEKSLREKQKISCAN